MIGLITLREEVHNKSLKLRRLDSLIFSTNFETAWAAATTEQQWAVKLMIAEINPTDVQYWVDKIYREQRTLGELSFGELLQLAQQRRIPKYTTMTKLDLVYENQQWEDRNGEKQKGNADNDLRCGGVDGTDDPESAS